MAETEEKVTEVTPTKEEKDIADLITKKRGNVSAVARSLKNARKTIYQKINNSEYLKSALQDARETTLDNAEDKLGLAIKKGAPWAICFTLKTLGKSRGYVERIEQTGADGGAIQVESCAQDLSKLSDDELLRLKEIQQKLNA